MGIRKASLRLTYEMQKQYRQREDVILICADRIEDVCPKENYSNVFQNLT
jgi:hypothetical protein